MKVLYIGNVGEPNTASAVHVKNRGIFINSCGHEVHLLCETPKNMAKMKKTKEITYEYMDKYPGNGKLRGIFWNLDQIFGMFYYKQSKKYIEKGNPDIVILYEPNSVIFVLEMLKLSKKRKFKLIVESTEWRNPADYKGYTYKVINYAKDIQKKYIDKKVGNTIAISSYLYEHYKKQNCNSILLPPIFPDSSIIKSVNKNENEGKVVKLVYAGSLSSKDYIDSLIKVIMKINKDKANIIFDIIGPSKNEVEKSINFTEIEKFGIICHGRLAHEETLKIVSNADFSVLLRMNMQYAKAGVSTKFCEAMMLGVPSICTQVGGTDLFVTDGFNGFLVSDNSCDSLEKVLLKILKLSRECIMEIKSNALESANEMFTSARYKTQFNKFLENCK